MKILYFVLGNPSQRLLKKRKKSHDILLNEDVIFFGPINENEFVYKGSSYTLIRLDREISVKQLFDKLPEGWKPDIVVVETSVLNYIHDFYNCPAKTLCFTRDAWGDAIYNRNMLNFFDAVHYQTIDIDKYRNNDYLLLKQGGSFYAENKKPSEIIPFKNRKIDILSIANYDDRLYHKRYKLFLKVSKELSKKYNIKIITGINVNQLSEYYRNSKIVVDWSFVNAIRVTDAVKHKCLCFSNEDNILIKEIWNEGEHYISYNFDNVINSLDYYLNSESESIQIIENASEKLKSLPNNPGQLVLNRINEVFDSNISISVRQDRISKMSQSEIEYCSATPLYFNYQYTGHNHPFNWEELYFQRIDKALSYKSFEKLRNKQLIEASRFAFLLKDDEKYYRFSSKLKEIFPEYPWTYCLDARIKFKNGNFDAALIDLDKAINYFEKFPDIVCEYILPFIEKNNSCDGRRMVDYMWESVHKHNNDFQKNAFSHEVFKLYGDVNLRIGNELEAIENYLSAMEKMITPSLAQNACELMIKHQQFGRMISISSKIIEEIPYDIISISYLSIAYLSLKRKKESKELLTNFSQSIQAFENKSKLINKITVKKIYSIVVNLYHYLPLSLTLLLIKVSLNNLKNKLI
ncbi:MAG: tetratricopeptide repeat protein [bacterium]